MVGPLLMSQDKALQGRLGGRIAVGVSEGAGESFMCECEVWMPSVKCGCRV